MSSLRYERLGEEIKKTLSEIVRELKDPRVCDMTTIMGVDVTNDLKYAKVRVSVYDKDDAVRTETVAALNNANGFIGREVGRRMEIRAIPKFTFILDSSIEYSVHISELLSSISKSPDKSGEE